MALRAKKRGTTDFATNPPEADKDAKEKRTKGKTEKNFYHEVHEEHEGEGKGEFK